MSAQNRDEHNRLRSKTIAFRVSPEENELLNMKVKLSGLTKQDYIIKRISERDVVVFGNPRVFKCLRGELEAVLSELRRIQAASEMDERLVETIDLITVTCAGMMEADIRNNCLTRDGSRQIAGQEQDHNPLAIT